MPDRAGLEVVRVCRCVSDGYECVGFCVKGAVDGMGLDWVKQQPENVRC